MTSILLTRAKEFNDELRFALQEFNYELLECNLIEYELQDLDLEEFYNYDNLLITSFFAARNVPIAPDNRRSAWVVGTKSAKLLESKGYKLQFCAKGAEELKENIPESIYSEMVYLSSDHITVQMPQLITRKIFYKVRYKESLSHDQILRYQKGIDYVLIYSENCAKTLIKLLLENNLLNSLANTIFIVISSKVENIIKPYFANRVVTSDTKNIPELVRKLGQ